MRSGSEAPAFLVTLAAAIVACNTKPVGGVGTGAFGSGTTVAANPGTGATGKVGGAGAVTGAPAGASAGSGSQSRADAAADVQATDGGSEARADACLASGFAGCLAPAGTDSSAADDAGDFEATVESGLEVSAQFQPSTVCAGGPPASVLWRSTTSTIPSDSAGRVLFHDVPAAGWLIVFEADGLARAWREHALRGPGPTAWPLLFWVDETTLLNLDQADDATFTVGAGHLRMVEHFSKQLTCADAGTSANYLNATLSWDIFGNEDVSVMRLQRDLVRGSLGQTVPASVAGRDHERTKCELSTSAVDSTQAHLLALPDGGVTTSYVLQNTRQQADSGSCETFAGSVFWDTAQQGNAIALGSRLKSECVGAGQNPQQHAETTPNAAIYSVTASYANGYEGVTCTPCTDDHAAAWIAAGGDVPAATTIYFVYSYSLMFDSPDSLAALVRPLEQQAGL